VGKAEITDVDEEVVPGGGAACLGRTRQKVPNALVGSVQVVEGSKVVDDRAENQRGIDDG
jgi:hypothetical protein